MKHSPEIYAKAFIETVMKAQKERQKDLLGRFLSVVKKNGDQAGFFKIFRQVKEMAARKKGNKVVVIEFARQVPQSLEDRLKNCFSPSDCVDVFVRPDLLAGTRILINNEKELDFSMRKKLRKVFL